MPTPHAIYSARGLSRLTSGVDEVTVPERPRFVRDLLRIPSNDGVYVVGGERQYVHGKNLEWLFSSLVPLMDGSRTLSEIASAIPGVDTEALCDVFTLLYMHGFLEAGDSQPSDPVHDDAQAQVREFFSRYVRLTGSCANGSEACVRLQSASVAVLCDDETLSGDFARLMAAHGIEKTSALRLADTALEEADADVAVAISTGTSFDAIVRHWAERDVPVLYLDCSRLSIGPLTVPNETPCPHCVMLQRAAAMDPLPLPDAVRNLWVHSLLARGVQRLVGYITMMFPTTALGQVESIDPGRGTIDVDPDLYRLPSCPTCGDGDWPSTLTMPSGHKENMALMFHDAVSVKPWAVVQPALWQQHLKASVYKTVTTAYRRHDNAHHVALATQAPQRQSHKDPSIRDALDQTQRRVQLRDLNATEKAPLKILSKILEYSAGGTATRLADGGFHLQRRIASGGNLGSAEVFALTSGAFGLTAGCYHYLVTDNILERLGECDEETFSQIASSSSVEPTGCRLLIVIASDVERVFSKYGNRAYIYNLLDAGLMSQRVVLLATSLGIRAEVGTVFDDEKIAEILKLKPPDNAVSCLISLYEVGP